MWQPISPLIVYNSTWPGNGRKTIPLYKQIQNRSHALNKGQSFITKQLRNTDSTVRRYPFYSGNNRIVFRAKRCVSYLSR